MMKYFNGYYRSAKDEIQDGSHLESMTCCFLTVKQKLHLPRNTPFRLNQLRQTQ